MKGKEKIAFVLAGGSIKGAYQIGQLKCLIQQGIYPDIITGISVGALNAMLYLNNLNGKSHEKAIDESVSFWTKNITEPSDLVKKKNVIRIAYEILFKKFNGILDTKKLEKLIKNNVSLSNIKKTKDRVKGFVGAVNIKSGNIKYVPSISDYFIDYSIASTRIPIVMPTSKINNEYYVDGGVIDNAGIGEAIRQGATKIYVLATHPSSIYNDINVRNIYEYIEQLQEIIVMNTLENDINGAMLVNSLTSTMRSLLQKRKVDIKVLRPKKQINVKITNFNTVDIQEMIQQGYTDALKEI